jgi:hypothetical protein
MENPNPEALADIHIHLGHARKALASVLDRAMAASPHGSRLSDPTEETRACWLDIALLSLDAAIEALDEVSCEPERRSTGSEAAAL